jgi:hypothetical protein
LQDTVHQQGWHTLSPPFWSVHRTQQEVAKRQEEESKGIRLRAAWVRVTGRLPPVGDEENERRGFVGLKEDARIVLSNVLIAG